MPTYRTDDVSRWGSGKASNLTPTDVDLNFWELWQAYQALAAGGAVPAEISNIGVVGSQMTIYLDDGRSFGPFTLPTALPRWRGVWAPATVYSELDLVRQAEYGTYIVLRSHTSAATFNPNAADGTGAALYSQLMPSIENREVLDLRITIKTDDHWLELADAHSLLRMNKADDVWVLIPANADTNFPIGSVITVQQMGAGKVWIAEQYNAGISFVTAEGSDPSNGVALRKRYSTASIIKLGPNEWTVAGDLEAGTS